MISNLFQQGEFKFHSGSLSSYKINCDALWLPDWLTLAKMASEILPPFGRVEGVPTGGGKFANCLRAYSTVSANSPLLIVDDVLTTGNSMEKIRNGRNALGIVVFARGKCPDWVVPLFRCHGV